MTAARRSFLHAQHERTLRWLSLRAPSDLHPPAPAWEGDLEDAEERGELSLVYQPLLNFRSNRIEHAEALLRWNHPTLGAISPADFIPAAERRRHIDGITRWVIDRVLADQHAMAAAGLQIGLAINLSGQLVADAGFTAWSLDRCMAAAAPITMEITETAVIDDPRRALDNLHSYAEAGIRIAIDDYGAGLSSLAYLKQLPARELKIDRQFIQGLTASHRDPLLVRSTIDLAHALDMKVTAEGVEDAMALSLLRAMGCDHIQGYHLARPMPLADLCTFIARFEGVQLDSSTLLWGQARRRER